MGFLNHVHFGKAAHGQEECSLSFRSVAQDCAVEHVCSKCKEAVHGNFISCARCTCGDLCSHCDRASATAESAGEPPGPPALLFHLVSTPNDPPSFQEFAPLPMRTDVGRPRHWKLHLLPWPALHREVIVFRDACVRACMCACACVVCARVYV